MKYFVVLLSIVAVAISTVTAQTFGWVLDSNKGVDLQITGTSPGFYTWNGAEESPSGLWNVEFSGFEMSGGYDVFDFFTADFEGAQVTYWNGAIFSVAGNGDSDDFIRDPYITEDGNNVFDGIPPLGVDDLVMDAEATLSPDVADPTLTDYFVNVSLTLYPDGPMVPLPLPKMADSSLPVEILGPLFLLPI